MVWSNKNRENASLKSISFCRKWSSWKSPTSSCSVACAGGQASPWYPDSVPGPPPSRPKTSARSPLPRPPRSPQTAPSDWRRSPSFLKSSIRSILSLANNAKNWPLFFSSKVWSGNVEILFCSKWPKTVPLCWDFILLFLMLDLFLIGSRKGSFSQLYLN